MKNPNVAMNLRISVRGIPTFLREDMDYIRREFAIGSDRELVTSALIYLAEQVRHGLSSLPKPESHLEEGV